MNPLHRTLLLARSFPRFRTRSSAILSLNPPVHLQDRVSAVSRSFSVLSERRNEHATAGDSIKTTLTATIDTHADADTGLERKPGHTNTKRSPSSIKSLNRQLASHKSEDLPEEELEEKFVRGSGPGGQSINKTSNSVSLLHIPTGIRIQCQETRSLQQNRKIARTLLRDKVNKHLNPSTFLSKDDLRAEKERRRKMNRAKKSKRKYGARGEEGEGGAGGGGGDGKTGQALREGSGGEIR